MNFKSDFQKMDSSDSSSNHSEKLNEINSKQPSDFSIDHILNHAGTKNNSDDISYDSFHSDFVEKQNYLDALNWIHYTRYCPPRIPRTQKQPTKRTPGRLPRVPFTPYQISTLEEAYKDSTYLSSEEANRLAFKLQLTNVRVKIWFQNRRARERRDKREQKNYQLVQMNN